MLTQKTLVEAIILWLLPEDHIQYGVEKDYGKIHTFFFKLQQTARFYSGKSQAKAEDHQLVPMNRIDMRKAKDIIPRIMDAFEKHYMAFNIYGTFPYSNELDDIIFYMAILDKIKRPDGACPSLIFNANWANPEHLADWTEAERWFLKNAGNLLRNELTPVKDWCIPIPAPALTSRT